MGKQDSRPGKSLGNPLNMLKTLGSGAKKLGMVDSGSLKHTFFYFRPKKIITIYVIISYKLFTSDSVTTLTPSANLSMILV